MDGERMDLNVDSDGDGIENAIDNCPNISNPDQNDLDNDDIGDVCDNDIDGDQLNNEIDLDDDNDGMSDAWETLYGFNPYFDDSSEDPDMDAFTNLEEFLSGTLPLDVNSYPGTEDVFQMESGLTDLPNTSDVPAFTSVVFNDNFIRTPLVFVNATNDGGEPCAIRIRNVTPQGFELSQAEPSGNDGPHSAMLVHYFAITPGSFLLNGRTHIEAGHIRTQTIQHNRDNLGETGWDYVEFQNSFSSETGSAGSDTDHE